MHNEELSKLKAKVFDLMREIDKRNLEIKGLQEEISRLVIEITAIENDPVHNRGE